MARKPKALPIAAPLQSADLEKSLDWLARTLRSSGFWQIMPSPLAQRDLYERHPVLKDHFAAKILEVGETTQPELVLNPTHFLTLAKHFLENYQARGPHVEKWFYLAPVFAVSADGILKSHELGMFVLGDDSGIAHAELLSAVIQVFAELGLADVALEINSLGCKTCQKDYVNLLREYLQKSRFELCQDCLGALEERPMKTWRCDKVSCQAVLAGAPPIVDFLDEACRKNLVLVLEAMDELAIPYVLNPALSGELLLERVLFEVNFPQNSKIPLGFGGNFSSWTTYLGAETSVPILGFLAVPEFFLAHIPNERRSFAATCEVFLVALGPAASRRALLLAQELKRSGVAASSAMLGNAGIKNQLKEALAQAAEIALIIGQKEALDETVILRDLRSSMQEIFSRDRIIEEVKKRLGRS